MDILAFAHMGPDEDAKAWALRMAHYALIGAGVGMLLIFLLVLITLVLVFYVVQLRRDIRALSKGQRRSE